MNNQKQYDVYLLPLAGYVGVTTNFKSRLRHHKSAGRNITYAEVIGTFKTKENALRFEATFHTHPNIEGGRNKHRHIHFHTRINKYQVKINGKFVGNRSTLEEAIQLRNDHYEQLTQNKI